MTTHTSEQGTYQILSAAHHRNGVGGQPFYVGIVKYLTGANEGERFHIVTVPPAGDDDMPAMSDPWWPQIYVTSLDRLVESGVRFGLNSWRGDHYTDEAKAIVLAVEEGR